jgi:hypothetical protein
MNKKYLWTWSVWIGLMTFTYVTIYALLPAFATNVLWMTFVALPIFFGGGALVKEIPHYFCSAVAGVLWGWLMLQTAGYLTQAGFNAALSLGFAVGFGTFLAIGIHMIPLGNTLFGKVTIVFGSAAMCFATGGQNLITVIGTLLGGIILGSIFTVGGDLLQKYIFNKETEASDSAEVKA